MYLKRKTRSVGGAMRAHVGDRLVVKGHYVHEPLRSGEILEVHGGDDAPPYLVRWDDGRVSLVFPGPDAAVDHLERHLERHLAPLP
jgi:uncharacterized protein DUF1918